MTQISRYAITITLETPAAFSDMPAMGNAVETLEYIPGSALRGMLASLYLNKHPANANFRRLFVDGAIHFPNLYLDHSRRLPLSAYSCKHHPGFLKDKLPAFMIPPHRVTDRLWDDFQPQPTRDCMEPSCMQPLTPLGKSFYTGTNPFQSVEPNLINRMSTAVVGSSGSARQGSLHSQQELAARQEFHGYLIASPDDYETLKAGLGGELNGYLGRKRAGAAQVNLDEYPSNWDQPDIVNSVKHPGQAHAAMTCTSDLILVDDMLRPITAITTENLQDLVNPPAVVQVVKSFAASRMVAGWLSVGRLFKENDLAIAAGSTFLFQFAAQDKEKLLVWMQELEMNGLGLRCSEGFGQVTFNEPLHKISRQRLERYLNNPTTEDFRL